MFASLNSYGFPDQPLTTTACREEEAWWPDYLAARKDATFEALHQDLTGCWCFDQQGTSCLMRDRLEDLGLTWHRDSIMKRCIDEVVPF